MGGLLKLNVDPKLLSPEDAAQQQSIIDHSQALLEELQGSGDYEYIGTLKQTIRLAKARLEASQNARVPYEQASA